MRQGSRAGWWDLLEFQRNEATDWEILDIVFKAPLLLGQGPWGAGLETNPGSQRDICTALMPSCLSRRRVLLSNIWFGLDPPALFSLSYHRILSFPTCRLFFFSLPKCGSSCICRKGQDEVRNYQFPAPAILILTRIWCLVFSFFPGKSSRQLLFSSEQFKCYPWSLWRYQLEREGWRICGIENKEPSIECTSIL